MQDFWNDIDWATLARQIALALVILLVTWLVAKLVKWAISKLTTKVEVMQRAGGDGHSVGEALGQIASLLVWLFGLVALLQVFGLDQVLTPIQSLLNGVMEFLPNIIAAALVFFVGALLAKIVRQLIETTLSTVPFGRWMSRARSTASTDARGPEGTTQTRATTESPESTSEATSESGVASSMPRVIATVVYALIMIVVTIAALQILQIQAISAPAERMLTAIFDAIPNIIAAAIVLGIGVLIARFAGDILQQVLDGVGTDRALRDMEVLPEGRSATPTLAKVAQVAIVLFFAVMAANLLEFPQITAFLTEVLELGGRVLFGGAIIAAGFFLANLLARMTSGTGSTVVRYATLVLFTAMGLRFMGVADSIIELAFGALVVGAAAAAALAFGLGGRDVAARELERMRESRGTGGGVRRNDSGPGSPPGPTI